MELQAQLKTALEAALRQMGIEEMPNILIQETPADKAGDFATPLVFSLAKTLKRNPVELAAEIVRNTNLPRAFCSAENSGPFINFFLHKDDFVRDVALNAPTIEQQSGKIVIEHTSVNPNKELHVGHLRNVVLGDSLARIMRAAGHEVEVQNYIDDTGRQAAESLYAAKLYGLTPKDGEKFDHFMGRGYVQLNADPAKAEHEAGITATMHALEAGEGREEIEKIVAAHLQTCFRVGATYDVLNWESDVVGSGFLKKAMDILQASEYVSQPDDGKYKGATVMNVSKWMPGLEEPNVVLVRSDGTAMYAAKDIGYQFWKFGLFSGMKFRPFCTDPNGKTIFTSHPRGEDDQEGRFGHAEAVINVIDSRQNHPQTVVRSAMGVAGHPEKEANSIHLSYAFVTLEGQTISGRKGVAVALDDALDEAERRALALLSEINPDLAASESAAEVARRVGVGSLRFAMMRAEPTRTIDFTWDSALALTGDTAPYVQYAAVRAANILKKAAEAGHHPDENATDWSGVTQHDLALAKVIARQSAAVAQAVKVSSPHVVAQYALELASAFGAWYNARGEDGKSATNVLASPDGLREARLLLVRRIRETFVHTLDLLGIEVPAAM